MIVQPDFMEGLPESTNTSRRKMNIFNDKEQEMKIKHEALVRKQEKIDEQLNKTERAINQMQ